MKLVQRKHTHRAAFTLIELLVVIAIIAILVGLLSAAVIRALNKGTEVTARHEITQLTTAIGTFKQKYGVYPPSRLRLAFTPADYPTGTPYDQALSGDSQQFILHCWPRCADNWKVNGIFWGPNVKPGSFVDLEGEQVLVFCLGGLQAPTIYLPSPPYPPPPSALPGCLGFATDPTNPMNPNQLLNPSADHTPPYFDFKSDRLVAGGNGFYACNDPWKTPYAYFSSGKRRNGYNAYYNPGGPAAALLSDCAALNVWPYIDPNNVFLNADTFQIISAGPDQAFGQGSNPKGTPSVAWTTKTGQTSNARLDMTSQTTPTGLDDFSNFYDKALGISQ